MNLGGDAIGLLHLAENLGLADHHGIQTGSDSEYMTHRVIAFMDIEGIVKLLDRDFVKFGNKCLWSSEIDWDLLSVVNKSSTRLQVETRSTSFIWGWWRRV